MNEAGPGRPAADRLALRLGGLLSLALAALPLLLLGVAGTWRGRSFALASLGAAGLPWFFTWARSRGRPVWQVALAAIAGLAPAWIALAVTSPPGQAGPVSRALHALPDSSRGYSRHVLGNWLPEEDQLRLGFTLMPAIDPLLTAKQAARLRNWTTEIYGELEADPDFRNLGSVLPLTYAELRGSADAGVHAYVYIPAGLDRKKPAPVLVFFHGSGGNWKAYLWILAQVADRCGLVVIAPTFGTGAWREPETSNRLAAALHAAKRYVALDEQQLHVAGLSNGGRAVSELLAAGQPAFRSYVFISPVFDDAALRQRSPSQPGRRDKVLILTGPLDERVPVDYVRQRATGLGQTGAQVELVEEPGADHFLMFSHRGRVIDLLANHLQAAPKPGKD